MNIKNKDSIKLFSLKNSELLAERISKKLDIELSDVEKITYADGEVCINASTSVRKKDVFVIASCSKPVNDNFMELLIFIDSLKRASANSITIVLTYYCYARQDRKVSSRQPITAKLIAELIEKAGATKLIVMDLHNPSIQGFFNIPLDDLRGQYVIAPNIKKLPLKFSIVSPDHGGASRARLLAELIADSLQISIIDKRRNGPNSSEIHNVLGDVKGKNCFIIDDMIDTGGTIIKAAKKLIEKGAKKVFVGATHGVFSKGFEQFEKTKEIESVIITDSIQNVYKINSKKLKIISLDVILAKAIEASIMGRSIKNSIYSKIKNQLKIN